MNDDSLPRTAGLLRSGPRMLAPAWFLAQCLCLVAIDWFGQQLATLAHLPLPGPLVGMILLFVLLLSGAVKTTQVEAATDPLNKHLAIFFIPLAVSLTSFGDLFLDQGLVMLLVILTSTALGIVTLGGVVTGCLLLRGAGR